MRYLVILLFTCCIANSQQFTPLDTTSYDQRKALKERYENDFKSFNKTISKSYSGKLKKEILNILEQSQKSILKNFTKNNLFFDNAYTTFLKTSIDTVKIVNPEIDQEYTILLSKEATPNAYSIGYNTIIVNLGLFKFLKNKQQIRAVLLHELAHEIKNHSFNSIVEEAQLKLSSVSKKQLEEIHNTAYNKGGLAFKQLRSIIINRSKKSRKQELEADSLGYVLFSKTPWSKRSFVNSLSRIKTLEDAPEYTLDSTIYKRLFNLKTLPFNEAWLKKEDFSSYNYTHFKEKINTDSIASHPELTERISKLKNNLPKDTAYNYIEPSSRFLELQKQAKFQQVASLYDMEAYGASLYSCLILLEHFPDMAYLLKYVGLNFNAIYNAQKNYKLNRYVEQLNPNQQSKSYNLFLNFIWNLKLKEMKAIADYYTN